MQSLLLGPRSSWRLDWARCGMASRESHRPGGHPQARPSRRPQPQLPLPSTCSNKKAAQCCMVQLGGRYGGTYHDVSRGDERRCARLGEAVALRGGWGGWVRGWLAGLVGGGMGGCDVAIRLCGAPVAAATASLPCKRASVTEGLRRAVTPTCTTGAHMVTRRKSSTCGASGAPPDTTALTCRKVVRTGPTHGRVVHIATRACYTHGQPSRRARHAARCARQADCSYFFPPPRRTAQ